MEQIDGADQSAGRAYEKWTKWLDPTINVLLTFSSVVGAAGLTIAPVGLIFSGIDILISAAKDFRESEETLVDIFECIGRFLKRLEIYTEVPQTTEMMDKIAQIMAEVLTILGIATRDIKQGRIKKFVKMLMGRTDMKDALERFDMLTREEAWMAIVRVMRAVHAIDETVALASIEYRVIDA